MPANPIDVVGEWLQHLLDPEVVNRIVAPDATYISLNSKDAELNKIMPWAGTSHGPQAFLDSQNLCPQAFIGSSDLTPEALIASTNLGSHRRKLIANLVAELQELRLETRNLFGQRFEALHATLQPIYTTGKSLLRHRRHLDCGKLRTDRRGRND